MRLDFRGSSVKLEARWSESCQAGKIGASSWCEDDANEPRSASALMGNDNNRGDAVHFGVSRLEQFFTEDIRVELSILPKQS